jgi:hypothetical protein
MIRKADKMDNTESDGERTPKISKIVSFSKEEDSKDEAKKTLGDQSL